MNGVALPGRVEELDEQLVQAAAVVLPLRQGLISESITVQQRAVEEVVDPKFTCMMHALLCPTCKIQLI